MNDLTVLIIIAQFLLKEVMYDHLVKQKEEKLLEKYAETYFKLSETLKEAIQSSGMAKMNDKLIDVINCIEKNKIEICRTPAVS